MLSLDLFMKRSTVTHTLVKYILKVKIFKVEKKNHNKNIFIQCEPFALNCPYLNTKNKIDQQIRNIMFCQ